MEPAKSNFASQVDTEETEESIVEEVMQAFRRARDARKPHEPRWIEGLRYYQGDQWGRSVNGSWRDTRLPGTTKRPYRVANKVRTLARKLRARATAARYGGTVSPLTQRDVDMSSAAMARSILAHYHVALDRDTILQEAIQKAIIIGSAFCIHWWEPNAIAPYPIVDESGEITDVVDAPLGDIRNRVVSAFELYPDPNAERWRDAEWLVHACRRSLSWVKKTFPDKGQQVKREAAGGDGVSDIQVQLDNITGDYNRDASTGDDDDGYATVYTYYYLPGPEYPKGKYAVVAGGMSLDERDWPFKVYWPRTKELMIPVIPLEFDAGIEGLWGETPMKHAAALQMTRNQLISSIDANAKSGDGKMIVPKGAEVSADAFKSGAQNEVIPYTPDPITGKGPEHWPNPPLNPSIMQAIGLIDQDLDDTFEVFDVDRGQTKDPMSGVAIQALQDASTSSGTLFVANIKRFVLLCDSVVLDLMAQFGVSDRLLMLQDTKTEEWQSEVYSFQKFTQGRYMLSVASTVPQTPAARVQTIQQMMAGGAFTPEQLPSTIAMLEMMELQQSDKLTDNLLAALRQQQARQDAIAAQAQQHAADMERLKQQGQGATLAIQGQHAADQQLSSLVGGVAKSDFAGATSPIQDGGPPLPSDTNMPVEPPALEASA
jgi:hypothetical protein